MIIVAIIAGLLTLLFAFIWLVRIDEYEGWGFGAAFFGIVAFIAFLCALNWNWGTQNLTGYIYSSNTRFGYTVGHIRFSENAGQDVQPQFCVKADAEAGKQITELAGSGKKVSVTIPPFFYFSNNPFACGTTETKIKVQ